MSETVDGFKSMTVPNLFPTQPFNGLAIVGEAPGAQEAACGRPFSGPSGNLLNSFLAAYGIDRNACFLGNVCQYRPKDNDIKNFRRDGDELQSGLTTLYSDLSMLQPKVILALGGTALWGLAGKDGIAKYRGSVLDRGGIPVIPTYHPAAALRDWSCVPLMQFDLTRMARALRHGYDAVRPPTRSLPVCLPYEEIIQRLDAIQQHRIPFAFDIEGGCATWSCCSIATGSATSFVVDWKQYTDREATIIYRLLADVLGDSRVPKVLQNSLYDRFVLAHSYRVLIRGIVDDTMLKHWELYPEFPKSLALQTSLHTLEPYYKDEGRHATSHEAFLTYCAKDSAVTYEISEALSPKMGEADKQHYRFNLALLNPLMYMMLRGFRYDAAGAATQAERLELEVSALNELIRIHAGRPLNVESPKQMVEYLYVTKRYKPYLNAATGRPTANEDAILRLAEASPSDRVLRLTLEARSRNSVLPMLRCKQDSDLRIRCSYNLVATDTGRVACYGSNTGSGYNLQTSPEELRRYCIADEGCEIGQADLKGADTYTVACHSARLGDPTMLDDLKAGIAIAKVVALMVKGLPVSRLPRPELLAACNELSKKDEMYFAAKCCVHGSNYLMGPPRMSDVIYKQSGGRTSVPAATCKQLQQAYFLRYSGVQLWHNWLRGILRTTSRITDAGGHTRRFYGRPEDIDTLKQAAAHEPQANTTYATNLALYRLWHDPQNRRTNGSLIVEPIHQVHDALVVQWRAEDRSFALAGIRDWFSSTLTIAGQQVVIPFEGAFGPSWGECETPIPN